jgi:hypothetical protein
VLSVRYAALLRPLEHCTGAGSRKDRYSGLTQLKNPHFDPSHVALVPVVIGIGDASRCATKRTVLFIDQADEAEGHTKAGKIQQLLCREEQQTSATVESLLAELQQELKKLNKEKVRG